VTRKHGRPPARPEGEYGFDAPWVPLLWLGLGMLNLMFAVSNAVGDTSGWAVLALDAVAVLFFTGGLLYVRSTGRRKVEV